VVEKFRQWWESKGGDQYFGDYLDLLAPADVAAAKELFLDAFASGMLSGLTGPTAISFPV
jgi:hypothetical protein